MKQCRLLFLLCALFLLTSNINSEENIYNINKEAGGDTTVINVAEPETAIGTIADIKVEEPQKITVNIEAINPFKGLLDINRDPLTEFIKLPIDSKIAYNIWYYREFHSYYTSYYELMNVEGMDIDTFLKLKDLVYIKKHTEQNYTTARLQSLSYILARQSDEEGMQEGVTDEWTDFLLSPFNINRGNYLSFLNFPNVSPVDAYSINLKLKDSGEISSVRSLRNTQGLCSYGYRNLRNFVTYSDIEYDNKFHLYGQIYFENAPYLDDDQEIFAALVQKYANDGADFLTNYFNTKPALMTKLRVRKELPKYGKEIKVGGLLSRQYGDDFPITRTSKLFFEYKLNDHNKLLIGDYRLAFGHGLIMENSDYYSPRKTGFGFSKRITGLIGDTSRTEEFRLHGVATELNFGPVSSVIFYSDDKKDAVLSDDGTVQCLIVNKPSLSNDDLGILNDIALNTNTWKTSIPFTEARDVLNEKTYGGQLRIEPFTGSSIAFTGYHSSYDRFFHPLQKKSGSNLFIENISPYGGNYDKYEAKIDPIINNEYFYLYDNLGEKKSTRTVLGGELSFNISNISFLGEYGKLLNGGDAVICSLYTQYNSLYLLALYRDIDVDFDNPYARPFAENPRFNDTFFEKANYMLANPLNANIYTQSPWSQPERGLYLETRYQFARNFTLTRAYLDLWTRKADNRPSMRFQGELEYRPIFTMRLRLKQKFLWNKVDNTDARSISRSSETTLRVIGRLSQFDQVSFEYVYSYTNLPPYPYLSNNADAGTDNLIVGTEKMYGSLYTFSYSRHFTKTFDLRMDITLWDSPSSSLWDWEDTRIDFMSGKGHKYWFVITDWLSPNISLKFKFWYKKQDSTERNVRKWWNDEIDPNYNKEQYLYLSNVKKSETALKFYLTFLY